MSTDRVVIPVLLYHSVADAPASGQAEFTVTPARFAEHVAAVAESGRVALTISQLADALRGERELPPHAVAVTFDDGFDDTPTAVEVLSGRGIPATVYVTAGRVARHGALSAASLAALVAAGAEIGAHTVTHPYLDEISAQDAAREIRDSKSQLEDHIGSAVTSFAYPHGAHSAGVRASVVAAGYRSAVAVKNALSHPGDDPFAIARWTVMRDTPTDAVEHALAGHGVPIAWRGERPRTRVFREYRRIRRRARSLAGRAAGEELEHG